MRHILTLFSLFLCVLSVGSTAAAQRPPNIIVILADDLGFSDIGCYGSEIRTPNLDRLAAGGLRFTQFYNCPRCCPARASLLTGLYPHQAGVGNLSPRDSDALPWAEVKDKSEWDLRMAVYAAMIESMDRGIGRVLDTVKQTGAEENTLVLFMSDNGACAEHIDFGDKPGSVTGTADSFRCVETGWANVSNAPFRLHKGWTHEGGISGPLIAYWPAVIKQTGGLSGELSHLIDIMATCLDAAGTTYPKTIEGRELVRMEGRSLLPVFQGRAREGHPALVWEHMGHRAVRQGKWKLVSMYPHDWELYDMEADRTELHDLAPQNPTKVQELNALYEAWAAKCGVLPWQNFVKRDDAERLRTHPEFRRK